MSSAIDTKHLSLDTLTLLHRDDDIASSLGITLTSEFQSLPLLQNSRRGSGITFPINIISLLSTSALSSRLSLDSTAAEDMMLHLSINVTRSTALELLYHIIVISTLMECWRREQIENFRTALCNILWSSA